LFPVARVDDSILYGYFQNAPLFFVKGSENFSPKSPLFFLVLLLDDTKKKRKKKKKKRKNARRFTYRDGPEWERRLGRAPGSVHVANQTVRFLCARSFFRVARGCARGVFARIIFIIFIEWVGFLPGCCGRDRTREMGHKADDATAGTRRARSKRVLTE
jgi:hypothetical protein